MTWYGFEGDPDVHRDVWVTQEQEVPFNRPNESGLRLAVIQDTSEPNSIANRSVHSPNLLVPGLSACSSASLPFSLRNGPQTNRIEPARGDRFSETALCIPVAIDTRTS